MKDLKLHLPSHLTAEDKAAVKMIESLSGMKDTLEKWERRHRGAQLKDMVRKAAKEAIQTAAELTLEALGRGAEGDAVNPQIRFKHRPDGPSYVKLFDEASGVWFKEEGGVRGEMGDLKRLITATRIALTYSIEMLEEQVMGFEPASRKRGWPSAGAAIR